MSGLTFPNTSDILAITCSQYKSNALGEKNYWEVLSYWGASLHGNAMYGFKGGS